VSANVTPVAARPPTADSGDHVKALPRTHSVTLGFRMRYGAYPRPVETEGRPQLTHVDASGAARMVDVSAKSVTVRSALAAGTVHTTAEVISLLRRDALPKGDALAVARVAGIMGAKRTPDLIPLCHPIALHGVDLALDLGETSVGITATVRTADRTGVEMEALTAVATAGLAMIDMIKAVDPAATISDVRVLRKEGGKTGLWEREADR
jgi:cyclic pyranopterin phosphate synthase